MSFLRSVFPLLMLAAVACSPGEDDSDDWWEDLDNADNIEDTDISDGTYDDKGGDDQDTDDKGNNAYPDCDDDFDATASCEGDWKETICMYEGKVYWCQDGAWVSEDDKGGGGSK
jgi:hypothetical protein